MTFLYAWGANSHGQLGLGFVNEQVLQPTRVDDLPDNLCENTIKYAVGGGGHTFLLTSQGKLFGAGWNSSGQVGNGTQVKNVPSFQLIRGLENHKVVSVDCGWAHSVALSSLGQVWVWGSNSHCQLGLPKDEVPFSCLPICLELSDVVSVSAGLRHTVVATKDGRVYSWGQGHRGQLGHLDESGQNIKSQESPRVVEVLESKVTKVTCAQNTTYALMSDGLVFAWGENKWGQLAHDPDNVAFFTWPVVIPQDYFGGHKILWIQAGWTHCAAGLASGEVYMWGRSDYGQLGPMEGEQEEESSDSDPHPSQASLSTRLRCRYIPNCLSFNKCIKSLSCGSEHNVALVSGPSAGQDAELQAFTWGWNEHGNCGDGSTINRKHPYKVPIQGSVQLVGAGSGHSLAVVKVL